MARRSASAATGSVRDALRARFSAPSFAYFEEVGNSTGFACHRHADAVAMSLWPSRGLHLNGIEIKASRTDWLKELSDPSKADEIARFCDFWWLAIADEKIVQPGELPENWGLLVFEGDKLTCKREAKLLEAEPLSRGFVGAILRRASEAMTRTIADAEVRGFKRGTESGPQEHQHERAMLKNELDRLRAALKEFEEKSGVAINSWNGGRIGDAVSKLMRAREADPIEELEHAAQSLERTAEVLRDDAKKMRAAMKAMPKESAA